MNDYVHRHISITYYRGYNTLTDFNQNQILQQNDFDISFRITLFVAETGDDKHNFNFYSKQQNVIKVTSV